MCCTIKMNTNVLYYVYEVNRAFVWIVWLDVDRNQCGQTSRPVVGTEIQACCNINASLCCYNLFLVNWCFTWMDPYVEKKYYLDGNRCSYNVLCGNLDLQLHEDLHQTTTSLSLNAKPCSPRTAERRRDSTEHRNIQKDSF